MKKLLASLFLLVLFAYDSYAQQDAQYTQYMFNTQVLNPAYSGTRNGFSGTAIYRHQWAGLEGRPRTFSIGGHSPFGEKSGAGLYLENDRIGVHNRLSIFASYAYRIPVGLDGQLSLGLQAGILNYTSNWGDLGDVLHPTDPILQGQSSRTLPNFGLGAFYYNDQFYAGLSIPHLLDSTLDEVAQVAHQYRHYFLTAGMLFDIAPELQLRPSIMVKSVMANAPISADINLHFLIRDALWAGVGYRFGDALAFMLEYQFQNGLRIGYAYDVTVSKLGPFNSGSHEVMLGFDLLNDGGPSTKVLSPRFF